MSTPSSSSSLVFHGQLHGQPEHHVVGGEVLLGYRVELREVAADGSSRRVDPITALGPEMFSTRGECLGAMVEEAVAGDRRDNAVGTEETPRRERLEDVLGPDVWGTLLTELGIQFRTSGYWGARSWSVPVAVLRGCVDTIVRHLLAHHGQPGGLCEGLFALLRDRQARLPLPPQVPSGELAAMNRGLTLMIRIDPPDPRPTRATGEWDAGGMLVALNVAIRVGSGIAFRVPIPVIPVTHGEPGAGMPTTWETPADLQIRVLLTGIGISAPESTHLAPAARALRAEFERLPPGSVVALSLERLTSWVSDVRAAQGVGMAPPPLTLASVLGDPAHEIELQETSTFTVGVLTGQRHAYGWSVVPLSVRARSPGHAVREAIRLTHAPPDQLSPDERVSVARFLSLSPAIEELDHLVVVSGDGPPSGFTLTQRGIEPHPPALCGRRSRLDAGDSPVVFAEYGSAGLPERLNAHVIVDASQPGGMSERRVELLFELLFEALVRRHVTTVSVVNGGLWGLRHPFWDVTALGADAGLLVRLANSRDQGPGGRPGEPAGVFDWIGRYRGSLPSAAAAARRAGKLAAYRERQREEPWRDGFAAGPERPDDGLAPPSRVPSGPGSPPAPWGAAIATPAEGPRTPRLDPGASPRPAAPGSGPVAFVGGPPPTMPRAVPGSHPDGRRTGTTAPGGDAPRGNGQTRAPMTGPAQSLLVDVELAQVGPVGAPLSVAVIVPSHGPLPRQPLRSAAVPPVEGPAPGPGATASGTMNRATAGGEAGDAGDGIRTGHPDTVRAPGMRTGHPRGGARHVAVPSRAPATLSPPAPAPGATPSPTHRGGEGPVGLSVIRRR